MTVTAPHETPEFRNSVEYTVSVTVTVAGGARWQTAYGRAERIAESLTNRAAKAAHVVEVTAEAGPSDKGRIISRDRVRFSAANTGRGTTLEPDKLDRYLDPEHERGLTSLAEANEAARERLRADRQRRQVIGCLNTSRLELGDQRAACFCAYCVPQDHERALRGFELGGRDPLRNYRCLCGRIVPSAGMRCSRHADLELVVLDHDPDALRWLAARQSPGERRREVSKPDTPRDQSRRRPDGPDLAPPGP